MVCIANVGAQSHDVPRSCSLHVAIAQVCKSILVTVGVVIVFPARGLDGLEEMDRLHGNHESVLLASERGIMQSKMVGNNFTYRTWP